MEQGLKDGFLSSSDTPQALIHSFKPDRRQHAKRRLQRQSSVSITSLSLNLSLFLSACFCLSHACARARTDQTHTQTQTHGQVQSSPSEPSSSCLPPYAETDFLKEDRSETSSHGPFPPAQHPHSPPTPIKPDTEESRFMGPKHREGPGMACSACYYLVISSTHLSNGHFRRVKGVFRGPLCPAATSDSPVGKHVGLVGFIGVCDRVCLCLCG